MAMGTPAQLKEQTGTGNLRDTFFALMEGGTVDEYETTEDSL